MTLLDWSYPMLMRPAPQLARAHGSCRAVDDAGERRVLPPGEARIELEVAPRRGIHRERIVARFAHERREVGQGGFLRVARVLQERTRGSDRERQVLRLAGEGRASVDIASELGLSDGTVRNYLSEAISKLGASNRVEAARIARTKGWL